MKLVTPAYYLDFMCIADKCKDNCCIGWEIDIDQKTAELYKNINGELGKKLKSSVVYGFPNTFILDDMERCPFLDKNNLCQIINNIGKQGLCQICRDHPRYFEWYDGIKEGGIGLCCEEAAKLILLADDHEFITQEIPFESCEPYDTNLYKCIYNARNIIIDHLNSSNLPLFDRICNILDYCKELQYLTDNNELSVPDITVNSTLIHNTPSDIIPVLNFIGHLEPINEKWPEYLSRITELSDKVHDNIYTEKEKNQSDAYLHNIMLYFIWRYFLKGAFDGEFLSRIKLAAVSTAVISYMFSCLKISGTFSLSSCADIAKNYSKEIEYSDENMNEFLNASYEKEFFSTEKIKGLFF